MSCLSLGVALHITIRHFKSAFLRLRKANVCSVNLFEVPIASTNVVWYSCGKILVHENKKHVF
jgi:hypothetical protein